MLSKKHRESLRGLSHEQKIKKLEKITRVPLQNLQTNIVESDLEEDDITVPLCHDSTCKEQSQKQKKLDQQTKRNEDAKKRVFDQQKVNRTIRTMTKQLFSMQKQKSNKNRYPQTLQTSISSFSIQEIDLELQKLTKTQTIQHSNNKSQHKRYQPFNFNTKSQQLTQITNMFNLNNTTSLGNFKKPLMKRRQPPTERQTLPYCLNKPPIYQIARNNQKIFQSSKELKERKQNSESNVTKRFSRSKRDNQIKDETLIDKKLKFYRSNQKNNIPENTNNKQNFESFQEPKRELFTQRLSYQHIPTYDSLQTVQTGLKKRKNICRNFISSYNKELSSNNQIIKRETIPEQKKRDQEPIKEKVKKKIAIFDNLSSKSFFRKFQLGKQYDKTFNSEDKEFLKQVFHNYKEAINLLRVSYNQNN